MHIKFPKPVGPEYSASLLLLPLSAHLRHVHRPGRSHLLLVIFCTQKHILLKLVFSLALPLTRGPRPPPVRGLLPPLVSTMSLTPRQLSLANSTKAADFSPLRTLVEALESHTRARRLKVQVGETLRRSPFSRNIELGHEKMKRTVPSSRYLNTSRPRHLLFLLYASSPFCPLSIFFPTASSERRSSSPGSTCALCRAPPWLLPFPVNS